MRGPGCFLGITVIALWLSLQPALGFLWKEWCWSWNSSTWATSCEELTHWKRLWCWEGLGAGGEEDDRGWDGWMASLTRWTWVWVNSGSWWWTGRPGVLWFTESQRVGHDWATELNWQPALCLPTLPTPSHHHYFPVLLLEWSFFSSKIYIVSFKAFNGQVLICPLELSTAPLHVSYLKEDGFYSSLLFPSARVHLFPQNSFNYFFFFLWLNLAHSTLYLVCLSSWLNYNLDKSQEHLFSFFWSPWSFVKCGHSVSVLQLSWMSSQTGSGILTGCSCQEQFN